MDIKKTIDNVGKLVDRMDSLMSKDVLVGVPADKTGRKGTAITNASLAYIHEYGSPARNIPARPFLHPGIRKIRKQAIAMLKQGAIDVLHGQGNVEQTLNSVGMLARNSVIEAITDPAPPFQPLKPATIRARLRKTAAGRRKIRQLQRQGKSLSQWAAETDPSGSANIHPLIDTGQLRAAITYVVR